MAPHSRVLILGHKSRTAQASVAAAHSSESL